MVQWCALHSHRLLIFYSACRVLRTAGLHIADHSVQQIEQLEAIAGARVAQEHVQAAADDAHRVGARDDEPRKVREVAVAADKLQAGPHEKRVARVHAIIISERKTLEPSSSFFAPWPPSPWPAPALLARDLLVERLLPPPRRRHRRAASRSGACASAPASTAPTAPTAPASASTGKARSSGRTWEGPAAWSSVAAWSAAWSSALPQRHDLRILCRRRLRAPPPAVHPSSPPAARLARRVARTSLSASCWRSCASPAFRDAGLPRRQAVAHIDLRARHNVHFGLPSD